VTSIDKKIFWLNNGVTQQLRCDIRKLKMRSDQFKQLTAFEQGILSTLNNVVTELSYLSSTLTKTNAYLTALSPTTNAPAIVIPAAKAQLLKNGQLKAVVKQNRVDNKKNLANRVFGHKGYYVPFDKNGDPINPIKDGKEITINGIWYAQYKADYPDANGVSVWNDLHDVVTGENLDKVLGN
jgi:hypothetical protein